MNKIGIFYGSSVGNTRFVAEKLYDLIPDSKLIAVEKADQSDIENCDFLILGTSTWGVGGLQDDFEIFVNTLIESDLNNKKIALFGLGDQYTYPDTFCNGMGKLYDLIKDKGCKFVGKWPTDSYDFSESLAVVEDSFVGLALDEDNEPDLTDYRLQEWVKTLNI
ncbi:flavodoxin [Plebeiibacterium sediminum]|uniref:Flavodoxin n=1 Tax=Plebeiibacterium sediminum TaxID=2992112 RepID=A0AAE3M3Y6_9BACT|nr:flavodoxin [Plebeiobacterium sediminum]MCW3786664.1 flavodoxin [Plebeiobacterium sediminum]